MKNNLLRVMLLATAVCMAHEFDAPAQSIQKHHEQTNFSAEDESVKDPVAIPSQVMTLLSKDELVRDGMENENITPNKPPSSWFSVSQITGSKDLIVVAEDPLVGANIVTFWVFIQSNGQYKLALMTRAHNLSVEKSRSHGYRNITASAENCCQLTTAHFHFDGTEYKESSEKTEDIK
jgi:hypothetical protein